MERDGPQGRAAHFNWGEYEVAALDTERVKSYWERRPCGMVDDLELGSEAYFRRIEEHRYTTERMIRDVAELERWSGMSSLEVGVGQGTDLVQFARAGAQAAGVDLTEAGIALARQRLAQERLDGDLRVADAVELPFADSSFDLVYSWGVLHHMPDPGLALEEIHRVLKPGGEIRLMLYSRHSWVALMLWLRHGAFRGKSAREVIASHMESPGTKAYTTQEIVDMLGDWQTVQITRWVTAYDRKVAGPLADRFAPRFGWFTGVKARKPDGPVNDGAATQR